MSDPMTKIGLGKTILVIEDDVATSLFVCRALEMYGYNVMTAVDGVDGLVRITSHKPDLIITDIMMPRLDGFGFIARIKERAETRDVPVIILSAKSDPESIKAGIDVGASIYLTKPIHIRELVAKVRDLVGGGNSVMP